MKFSIPTLTLIHASGTGMWIFVSGPKVPNTYKLIDFSHWKISLSSSWDALFSKFSKLIQASCAEMDKQRLVDQINDRDKTTADNVSEAFHKCIRYQHSNTRADLLKACQFEFLLNPECTTPSNIANNSPFTCSVYMKQTFSVDLQLHLSPSWTTQM